ncbi:hypothetical protein U2F10_02715 [Leptothoe sp. EHU-05/26/07-4]
MTGSESTIKVATELKNKSLVTIKNNEHGHLKGIVATFLKAYIKNPSAMLYMANAILSDAPWQKTGVIPSSEGSVTPVRPKSALTEDNAFGKVFKNARKSQIQINATEVLQ